MRVSFIDEQCCDTQNMDLLSSLFSASGWCLALGMLSFLLSRVQDNYKLPEIRQHLLDRAFSIQLGSEPSIFLVKIVEGKKKQNNILIIHRETRI